MGVPRQEYWSILSFPSPGNLANPRIEPKSPVLGGEFFTTEPPGKALGRDIFAFRCLKRGLVMTCLEKYAFVESLKFKNMGIYFRLIKARNFHFKVKVKVTRSCPTLCNPMDYTVHGILQARILEWVAFPFSRGSSQPRDQTQVSHVAGGFFTS